MQSFFSYKKINIIKMLEHWDLEVKVFKTFVLVLLKYLFSNRALKQELFDLLG